jgi:predicted Zn-dependent peptidase
MPGFRSVALGMYIKTGSGNETADNNGISHFLEHMLFKGTRHRSAMDIAVSLESLGGKLNASTGKEISLYSTLVLNEHLPVAVDVLSDMVLHSVFDEREIEREKGVILSEIRHAHEDPEELTLDYLYQHLYPEHPLGYFILGQEETVRSFTRDDLQSYLESQYTPDRIVFAAAGHIDHDRLVDLVRDHTAELQSGQSSRDEPALTSPLSYQALEHPFLVQSHLAIGTRTFGSNDPRKYSLAFMDVMLGGGMSSRLFQNIREKYGFAYSVYCFADFMQNTGVFCTYVACAPDKAEQTLELIQNEFKALKDGQFKGEEIDRIKAQIEGNILLAQESTSGRMHKLGEREIYDGQHYSLDDILAIVDRINASDVIDIANEFLDPSQLTITVLSPQ